MSDSENPITNSLVNNEYVQKLFDRLRLLKVSKDMLNNALEDCYTKGTPTGEKDEDWNEILDKSPYVELIDERDKINADIKKYKEDLLADPEVAKFREELKETNSKIKEEAKLLSEALELAVLNKIKLNVVDENGKPLNISVKARLKSSKKRSLD